MYSLYYGNDCIEQYQDVQKGINAVEDIHAKEPSVLVELLDDEDNDRCIVGYN